jgi:hypothetical protein
MDRPFFAAAWAASQQVYDPVNSGQRVATLVGGYVEKNINNSEPSQKWTNTCAVRMSYILNHAGFIIPRIPGQTVSGRDQQQYFFRVKNLITFLEAKWGKPNIVYYPPPGGGTPYLMVIFATIIVTLMSQASITIPIRQTFGA